MRHARREVRPDRDSDFRELTDEQVTGGPEIVVLGEDEPVAGSPSSFAAPGMAAGGRSVSRPT